MRIRMRTKNAGTILLLALLALSWGVHFITPPQPPAPPGNAPPTPPGSFSAQTSGDFDRDFNPDLASLYSQGSHKRISISFGNFKSSHLLFESPANDLGRLFSSDIDQDQCADLVWIPLDRTKTAVIWLGDGQGRFAVAKNPEFYAFELDRLFGNQRGADLSSSADDDISATCPARSYWLAVSTDSRIGIDCFLPTLDTSNNLDRSLEGVFPSLHQRGPPQLTV